MARGRQKQLTTARQLGLIHRRMRTELAILDLPQEEPVPALHAGWISHVSHCCINGLAAFGNVLWAATCGGVVRWRWEGQVAKFTRYGSEHGLPGSYFEHIVVDPRGCPWVGGRTVGLSYLDGVHWRSLSQDSGLPSLDVLCIAADPQGTVWASTLGGLGQVSLADGHPRWRPFDLSEAPLPIEGIQTLAVGPDGDLWLGTAWGLFHYLPRRTSWEHYRCTDGLPDSFISCLHVGPDERLWVGTAQGLCVFDGKRFEHIAEIPRLVKSIAFEETTGISWCISRGEVWRHTDEGWYRSDSLNLETQAQGRVVATDGRNRVWVGFDACLVQYLPQFRVLSMSRGTEPPPGNVTALAVDTQNRVWAGLVSGLWIYDQREWIRCRPKNQIGSPLEGISQIAVSPKRGEVWVGSWIAGERGRLRRFSNMAELCTETRGPAQVDVMTFDTDARLWVASAEYLWMFDGLEWCRIVESPNPGDLVQAILVDADGRLWCGSTAGLDCYENGHWKQWIIGEEVNALAAGATGRLWIGTSRGLHYVEGGVLQSFEDDLPAEEVLALTVSKDGDLWIGTSDGLARLRGEELSTWRAEDSGLTDGHIRALAVDDYGTLWTATAYGVSQFDPRRE